MSEPQIPDEAIIAAQDVIHPAVYDFDPDQSWELAEQALTAAYPHLRRQIETEHARAPLESYTITTECRANRGDVGAWDEAVARLRVVYNAQLARFGPAAIYRVEFHREPAPGIPGYVYEAARGAAQPGGEK